MNKYSISAVNPFRPPDWRIRRARFVVDNGLAMSRKYDDEHIHRAVKFLRRRSNTRSDADMDSLFANYPDIYVADDIYSQDDDRYQMFKWEVEARLLAGSDDVSIASQLGVHEEAIATYEKLYFSVRDKLRHRSYILHTVIGPSVALGIRNREPNVLWKLFGYMGGPSILNEVISTCHDIYKPNSPGEHSKFWNDMVLTDLRRRAAISLKTMRSDDVNHVEILNLFVKILEIERSADGVGNTSESMLANIQAAMECLKFSVHDVAPKELSDSGDSSYHVLKAELRTEELVAYALGQEISPEAAEQIATLGFPAAKNPKLLESSREAD